MEVFSRHSKLIFIARADLLNLRAKSKKMVIFPIQPQTINSSNVENITGHSIKFNTTFLKHLKTPKVLSKFINSNSFHQNHPKNVLIEENETPKTKESSEVKLPHFDNPYELRKKINKKFRGEAIMNQSKSEKMLN